MIRILAIDDLRNFKQATATARTYEEGIRMLIEEGPWDELLLDHDLGDELTKTGYDILCFLEENPKLLPRKTTLVTANPVGRMRMQLVLDKIYDRIR